MESKKRNLIILISIVLVLMITLIGFSFAYFAINNTVTNNLNTNVNIAGGNLVNFTVTGSGNLNVNVSGANMLNGTINSVAGTNTTTLTVSLQSDDNITCTYDIVWSWNSGYNSYTKTTYSGNEFTVSGTSNQSQTLSEVQLPNYSTSTTTLGSYSITANNTTTSQVWTFTGNFYNINANQDNHAGHTYSGKIAIANSTCTPGGGS